MTDSTPRITRSRSPKEALVRMLNDLGNRNFKLIFSEAGIDDIFDLMAVDIDNLKEITAVDVHLKVGKEEEQEDLKLWTLQMVY